MFYGTNIYPLHLSILNLPQPHYKLCEQNIAKYLKNKIQEMHVGFKHTKVAT
jgi:hypothetical protein